MSSGREDSIGVTYTLADIVAAMGVTWRRWAAILVLTFASLALVQPAMSLARGWSWRDAWRWNDWTLVAGVTAAIAVWIAVTVLARYWLNQRKGLNGPIRLELKTDGIRVASQRIDSMVYWPALKGVVARRDRLFFLLGGRGTIIAPARAFASRDDFDRWVRAATAGVAESRT